MTNGEKCLGVLQTLNSHLIKKIFRWYFMKNCVIFYSETGA